MSYVYTENGNGLVLAEQASDERALQLALKRLDEDLRLGCDLDQHGRPVYKVMLYRGPEHPAAFVCGWWDDDFTPRPLSSGLVSMVEALQKGSRAPRQDEDAHNRHVHEQNQKDFEATIDAIAADMEPHLRETHGAMLHRGVHLRRARDKQRRWGANI